jgi:hypothetical protein
MSYREAKDSIFWRSLISNCVFFIVLSIITLSTLLFIYDIASSANVGTFLRPICYVLKAGVIWLYQHTTWIGFVWDFAPRINGRMEATSGNLVFAFLYVLLLIACIYGASAAELKRLVKEVETEVKKAQMLASLQGAVSLTRSQMLQNAQISSPTVYGRFHTVYLAPIVVGFIVLLLSKLPGIG